MISAASSASFIGSLALALSLLAPMFLCAAESSGGTNSVSTNSTVPSQKLTAEEAKRALEHAHQPEIGSEPGTWRRVDVQPSWDNGGTNPAYLTNTVYEWHRRGAQVLRRTERIDPGKSNSVTFRPHVQVDNEEGSWALHDNVAIFFPPSSAKTSSGYAETAGGFVWGAKPMEIDDSDPELAGDIEFTGERFEEEGRWVLRITKRYGEKWKIKITRMLKKQIPLLFRPFVKTAELRKMVDSALPLRYESLVDASTSTVIVSRAYSSDGLFISETQGWQPWHDLPPEQYSLPTNIPRVRPKTLKEANHLDSQVLPGE